MAELFVLRLGRQPDQQVGWIVADDDGTRRSPPAAGTLAEAAAGVQGRPVIVLVPATESLTTTIDLPIRSTARLLAALPYALEEQIATDVETMHFAAGDKRESGRRPVSAVSRAALDAWLQLLEDVGIQPWKIVPETYGLARIPGTLSALIDDDCVMFNDGADLEFALDGAKPSDALVASGHMEERSDDSPPEPSGHLVVYCNAADEERLSHDWIALRHELASVDINLLPDGALPRLAVTVASGAGVNLLQGRYGPKADYGSWLRPWRRVAVLLLTLTIVGFGAKGADYWRLTQEEVALQAQFTTAFQQIRPGASDDILDPVAAVNSIKRSLGTSTTTPVFLAALSVLAAALTANDSVDVEAVSFRAGVIDVRITTPDVETVGKIQKAVSASGQFSASIQSSDRVGERVNSRIQVREGGS